MIDVDKRCDVLIVGAGIIGLASAYHIKLAHPELSVVVIDKLGAAGQGDTAKSNAAVRDTFTSSVNRALARSTIEFYRHVQEDLGFNLNLDMVGYLWLLSGRQAEELAGAEEGMRMQGTRFRIYEADELTGMIPDLVAKPNTEQSKLMCLAFFHLRLFGVDCGVAAPELIVDFYVAELRKLGAELRFNTEAESLQLAAKRSLGLPGEPLVWQEKEIKAVKTTNGSIEAGTVVLSAGVRNPTLLDPIGFDCLIKPRKNQLFQVRGAAVEQLLRTEGFNESGTIPFMILPKGEVYLRPVKRESSFWVAAVAGLGRGFGFEQEPVAEEEYYTSNVYPVLSEYFPCFRNLRPTNMWAGFYDVNSLDSTPIIAKAENCIITTGMSGSGIMKADAVGRVAAAVYDGKDDAELFANMRISTAKVGLVNRTVEPERFVI